MATYEELFDLKTDSKLRNRVCVAIAVKAQSIIDSNISTKAQVAWASEAIRNPDSKASELLFYVLAANKTASVDVIKQANDAAIQSNISKAVDALIAGGV